MIRVSRLNRKPFVINAEFIETIDETPDTVITLQGGKKFVVREGFDDVIEQVLEYRRLCGLPPREEK